MRMLVAILLLLLAVSPPAHAQNIQRCSGYDTLNYSTSTFVTLVDTDGHIGHGGCNVTTGPKGMIFATAAAEVSCGVGETESVQMFVGSGLSPTGGANFNASFSGGNMTVTFMVDGYGPGSFRTFGPIINPGSGGVAGPTTYSGVVMTGGTGQHAQGNITVTGGSVTAITPFANTNRVGYTVGDILSANPADIGGVTGFQVPVATVVDFLPWIIKPGQTVTGAGVGAPTQILSQTSATSGGPLGGFGVYVVTNAALSATLPNLFSLDTVPGGVTYITPTYSFSVCRNGFFLATVSGVFQGAANSPYYVGLSLSGSDNIHVSSWNNQGIVAITY